MVDEDKIYDLIFELEELFFMDPYTNPLELIHKAARECPDLQIVKRKTEEKRDPMSDMTYGDLIKAIRMYRTR